MVDTNVDASSEPVAPSLARRIAYVSLQAVEEGQDSWAAVNEIITPWRDEGWTVDTWFVEYPNGAPGALGRARAMFALQRALRQRLDTYDAVYMRGHMFALPVARAARSHHTPVFQECNGTYEDLFVAWPAARIGRPLFEWMMREQYRHAQHIFCGTEQQRAWLRAETGHDRITVSPNGANSDLFVPDAPRRAGLPDRYVLFFGQFAPWQGIETLVAAKDAPAWPIGVDLVFVGDGARRDVVEAAACRADSGVHYLGKLPYSELPGVIAHCVASTSPQFTAERGDEGFSALKLYESMSCGVPVIGSDYPGVGDVIRRYGCGLVVTPGDADALAAAVAEIVAAPDEAAAMGRRGRAAIESECSWTARARQRLEIMERFIAEKQAGVGQ